MQAGLVERGLDGLEIGHRAQHLDRAVLVADHILGAGIEGDLHHAVLVHAGTEDELPAVLELEGDRAFGAEVAAVFAERMAHLGDGAHAVVGHGVDDDRRAADAIALVADFLVAHAFEVAGRLVDILLDGIGRHVGRLGLFDRQPQARIHAKVAAALARRDRDLADHAGPDLAAFFILPALAVLDVGPLGMSGHECPAPSNRRAGF